MQLMNTKTLSVKITGAEDDDGNIVLGDLKAFVSALTSCLKRIERKFDDTPRMDYLVTDAKPGSLTLAVTPTVYGRDKSFGPLVLGLFTKTVKDLETGERPDNRITSSDLVEFKKLLTPTGKVRSVVINRTPLTDRFGANIDRLLEAAVVSEGSAKGMVDTINVHNKNEFTLFPLVGEPIRCTFPDSLFESVRAALRRCVTVYGKMHRFLGNTFPEKATVARLEVHPTDDELPRLSEMGGSMAGSFGNEGATEFLRKIRSPRNGD